MEVIQGFRLSPQQRRVWLLQSDSNAYRAQCAISIDGPLEIEVLKETIHRLIERHEILRTTFEFLPGMKIPVQVTADEVAHVLSEVDFSDQPEAERSGLVDQLFDEMHVESVDAQLGVTSRYTLVRLSPVEHVLLIHLPALCADRQTLNNLLGEVSRLYLGITQESQDSDETVQYAQFSAWQHELLEESDSDTGNEFWLKQGSINVPSLRLPLESSPTEVSTFAPRTHTLKLADDNSTLNLVFLFTCWQSLLQRLTKQNDIAVRYLFNGRVYEEMSDAFGLYDRWPLLHSSFEEDEPFTKVLEQIDRTVTDAREWQEYYQGGDEVEESVGFDFTEQPAACVVGDLKFAITRQYSCTERMKLRLSCTRTEHALIAEFHYDPSFYSEFVIENLAGQFASLVRNAASRSESPISQLDIVGDNERQILLLEWNATQAEFDRDATIQQLFETQASLTPDALAVLYDDQKLSFQELNCRANQLARHLRSLGVGAETRLALCIERSAEMIVGLLGILKAGGAYVPLDAAQPASRLSFMLEDAQVAVLITQESLNALLPAHNAQVVCLDTDSEAIAQHNSSNLPTETTAQNLAYMIYTSGSTGRPKGTMIEHRSVINLLGALKRTVYADVDHALRISVNAPLAFDSSVKQVIQLLSGHALCVIPEDVRRDGERMLRYLSEHQIDVLDCTPSQLRLLLSAGLGSRDDLVVRRVLVGGEAIDATLWQELASQDSIAYFNVYGPTECTVDTTVRHIAQDQIEPTLGRAISNVQVYLLDERQQLIPVGMTGELCIGGEGVGRGYHNRAELTSEKFIPDQFSSKAGARLYRTGDAARYTAAGELEFLGRLDGQVKIRGSRIELGEVEVALSAHPSVQTCVVVAREDVQGGARLVAYVVLHEGESSSVRELRTFLSDKLPDYMIPSVVMFLEAMPLTPNGKIDRQALPAPGQVRSDDEEFAAPRTPGEGILASMWEHLLGVERVGINDDFFELGGHSLLAMQLISRVREAFQIEIPLPALFAAPTVSTLAVKIEEIVKAGDGLLAPPIQPVPRTGSMPLSFAQTRLWFLHQLDPDSALYNIPLAIRLRGGVNVTAMEQSLTEIVRRHQVLRTTYATAAGQPIQIINPPQAISLPVVDLSVLRTDQREAEARRLATAEAQRPFNLSEGPLMRATFLKLDEDEHVALFTMHHITSDGWSMALLTREVAALYDAFSAGAASPLAELPVQYADFAQWQRNWLRGEVLDAHLDFWRQQLDGAPPLLQLPTDRPRPAVPTYRGASVSLALPVDVSATLKALSREEGTTLFMTMLAAFQTLLYRYTGQSDIVVGSAIAGRNRAEIEGLIGFFVNTLVLRTNLSGRPTFRELLARVREVTLGAYAHQDLPFEVLVEALQPDRNLNYNPLFQVMVVLQNTPRKASGVSGLSLNSREVDSGTAKFDLHLAIHEGTDRIGLGLEYSTDLFDEKTIQRMLSHFNTLLQNLCAHPDAPLVELPLLTHEESRHLLHDFNHEPPAFPPALCLHQLFEAQAAVSPDAIALSCEDQHSSYREVNERANRLAHHLRGLGVGPEDRVGLLLNRSADLVIALLGILKAGAAYLPLDPAYPQDRLAYMLADAGARVVVTEQALMERWLLDSSATLVCLDDQALETAASTDLIAAEVGVRAENAAYVIYTSGSTGKPKGVVVTHENVWRLMEVTRADFEFDEQDVWTLFHSICFDFSVWELWGALAYGGRLVVVPYWVSRAPDAFYELLSREKVTVLNQTPSAFRQLMKVDEADGEELALRVVIFGGEALEMSTLKSWFERHGDERPRLVNMYGITETTVHVTYRELRERDTNGGSVIGGPLADLDLYVLDQQMRAVPEGISGELYVGGGGVARGYLGRAELTAQRFVPHPYSEQAGSRLYRTGDLARRRADGELEYLGRVDEQVKIRGFRIELGEIANALREQTGVRESIVLVLGENGEEKRIVAYVVADHEKANAGELREELKQRLPEYMIPSAIVMLVEMPLTRNGKVDRRALPAPAEVSIDVEGDFVAPRTPVEEVLAGIWYDVLNIARIGVNDSFFELGGHSLLAMQIVSRIREAFGVEIPVRAIFEKQTLAMQATEIEQLMNQGGSFNASPVVRTSREAELPLSFAQQRLWFIDRLTPESPLYNMPIAVRLDGTLNVAALERTLREIVRRHEALRTNIVTVEGNPAQVIHPETHADEICLPLVDLGSLPEDLREAEMQRLAQAEAIRPFNLETDTLMRMTVLRLHDRQHIALLTFHHIISDGWSMGVFVKEVAALYNAFSQGLESPLAELPVQYADYAVWQREWLQGEVLEQQIGYWKQQLEGAPELLELPTDRPRPAVQTHRGATVGMVLSKDLTAKLHDLCRAEGATLYMLLLAVFKVLLARYTGQVDINVGTPIAGRNRVETEGLIGFFVNTLVLRTDLSGKPTMRELIRRVKEVALAAYAHQELPFEKLVDELQVERSLSHTPLFQVLFALQNAGQDVLELPGLSLSAVGDTGGITKFDLMLNLSESGEAISGALVYNTDLFDSTAVTRMLMHFQMLLESVVANPNRSIASLPILADSEREVILHNWNDTERPFPSDLCVHQLFEAQVLSSPDSIALICDDLQLSYSELNERANQLAHHLRRLGVGMESPVAILMERNVDLIVSLLAILKAGGCYLPLDPDYPQERLSFMLRDANVRVLLTQSNFIERLPQHDAYALQVDAAWPTIAQEMTENLTLSARAENVAYVIYTSGSTGEPKGVEVTHRNIARLLFGVDYVDLETRPRILQMASISFDASTFEVWGALLHGGCCVLYPERVPNYEGIGNCIARHEIDVLWMTASLFNAVVDEAPQALSGVKQLLVGGEALSVEHIRRAQKALPGVKLTNGYGPTESTTFACCHPIGEVREDERAIPIGRAIGNTQAYILDGEMEVVGVGIKGELYLGGEGLARGYLKRSGLTAERFVPNPFSKRGGERLYRTGDVCRYREDGTIEYVGRVDEQVKVRGFRIELGEIETVLAKAEGIAEAVVLVREQAREKRLVAYVVGEKDGEPSASEMRKYLAGRLPDYMIPGAFVVLEEMPITANGKVDKKKLPEPTNERPSLASEFIKPQTPTEQSIAAVWKEILHLSEVGIEDNFFDLGGNSLLLVQLHARLQKIFGEQLTMVQLFEHPTIGSLAAQLSQEEPSTKQAARDASRVEKRMVGQQRQRQRLEQRKRALKGQGDSDV